MMNLGMRFALLVGALVVFRLSFLIEPVYVARPIILLEPMSILLPPRGMVIVVQMVVGFLVIWLAESLIYNKVLGLEWREALGDSLRTYSPLAVLWGFVLLLVPGLPILPVTGWWLLLDARYWLLTVAVGLAVSMKAADLLEKKPDLSERSARLLRRRAVTILLSLLFLATLVVLTPKRRFTQRYDERWGTGDEPRYVRIAASLLHDGDADISNASELIGKRAELGRFIANLSTWIPATLRTLGEIPQALFGSGPEGRASPLGGQVIQGRKGGTYYVYLPGFPLLLVPAMAVDSYLHPHQLSVMVFACLLLGVATVLSVARLVEPFVESRAASYGIALAVGLTIPLFLHHFQAYPEVAAALSVAVMSRVVLAERLDGPGAFAFAAAGVLMPWLHPKVYPIWGISVLFFVWKAWREKAGWKRLAAGVGFPILSMALLCLYVFHISGSLMPDALWVLNGYPRGASLVNRTTPAGLYHLFFGSWQGLLVYGPMYILVLPGCFMLRKRSSLAFVLVLLVSGPYLIIAASHDLGGAGGWIPAARYMVVLVPVFALGMTGWVSGTGNRKLRWFALFLGAAASFWIAQGMLEEPNFVYDRPAFLASRHVNVSPSLGTVLEPQPAVHRVVYPLFLLAAMGLFGPGERWKSLATPMRTTLALLAVIVVGGALITMGSAKEAWIARREGKGPVRLRPGRSTALVTWCEDGRGGLRFEGAGGPHNVTVRGIGLERHLRVPRTGATELGVSVEPIIRISSAGRQRLGWLVLELGEGQTPLTVQSICN